MPAPRREVPRRPDPEPIATDDVRVVLVGLAAWALLLVLTLVLHDRLADHGKGDWVWIALAGVFLGGIALPLVHRRKAAVARDLAAARARRRAPAADEVGAPVVRDDLPG